MPLQATSGAASYDAFGGGVAAVPNYIEDVFSTYLYSGTGSAQTITNGIDLSTKGGLVWIKSRETYSHRIFDTARGVGKTISSNSTGAQFTDTTMLSAFNTTGFSLGFDSSGGVNDSGYTFASWTFRRQPKFFDVVTYTGTGSVQNISHNLGSVPGCIIVKSTTATEWWAVQHRSLGATKSLYLNSTNAEETNATNWNNTSPTSTQFTVGTNTPTNLNGATYVAYIFAHNAGGFGLTGTDNVISCGSYTEGASATTITLGYEPQWILLKRSSGSSSWYLHDTMRGMSQTDLAYLQANSSAAESNFGAGYIKPTATGFIAEPGYFGNGSTVIYIAIRRGPMKVPTSGTSVFSPNTANTSAGTPVVTNFPVDLSISVAINGDTRYFSDRLRGVNSTGQTANQPWIASNSTGAELTNASIPRGWDNTQILVPPYYAGGPTVWWNFKRAPSFFDEVCWTRSTTTATLNHNLGVVPELIIKKDRSRAGTYWDVMPNVSPYDYRYDIYLNDTQAISGPSSIYWNAAPTATTFDVHMGFDGSSNGDTFVAYLFATCAGVSKVGSYTGTGTTLQINCGFTGGSRFVLIKRTDSTGDWYVWDSARGIVSGNDPYLLLNSTAAEVTNTDYVDTYSAGFEISSTAPAAINASGGTFIFLAIA